MTATTQPLYLVAAMAKDEYTVNKNRRRIRKSFTDPVPAIHFANRVATSRSNRRPFYTPWYNIAIYQNDTLIFWVFNK